MYHKQGNCNGQCQKTPTQLHGHLPGRDLDVVTARVVVRDCSLADAMTKYSYPMSAIDAMVRSGKAELYSKAGKRFVRIYL